MKAAPPLLIFSVKSRGITVRCDMMINRASPLPIAPPYLDHFFLVGNIFGFNPFPITFP